jgi:transposase
MNRPRKVTQIGCDVHRKFSTVTARDQENRIVWRERLNHTDRAGLRTQLRRWPKGTPVIVEGTFGWGWLSDEMAAAGLDPHLASSRKVAGWRDVRGMAKSDRTDADLLSELWSEKSRWWEVWLAPPEVRNQREWLRYRMGLVRIQTGVKNRIHAILHRHGIVHPFADLFGTQGRRFLSLLATPADARLPESGRVTLKGHLQLLDQVRRQIAGATREFRKQVTRSPVAQRLMTLPGISWILSYTILAEVGCIERFYSAKHLASYSLLAPRAYDSGEDEDDGEAPKGRHVGHVGRRTLKWAWIEAAHGAVRKGGRFRAIFDRRTNAGKRDRNRGYIAVAHQLSRIGYVLWSKGIDYSESPPPRPGLPETSRPRVSETKKREKSRSRTSKTKPRTSRPGTGQPDRPMVAAIV